MQRVVNMEIDDIRAMNIKELQDELESSRRESMNLRFQLATMQLADSNQINKNKKRIARIKTIIRERELAGNLE